MTVGELSTIPPFIASNTVTVTCMAFTEVLPKKFGADILAHSLVARRLFVTTRTITRKSCAFWSSSAKVFPRAQLKPTPKDQGRDLVGFPSGGKKKLIALRGRSKS